MSPEQQRIAIAEACGWNRREGYPWSWIDPRGGLARVEFLPDYCNDLNAMHEAEEYLHGTDWATYFDLLQKTGKATGTRATASQRSECFLRVLGKWKP